METLGEAERVVTSTLQFPYPCISCCFPFRESLHPGGNSERIEMFLDLGLPTFCLDTGRVFFSWTMSKECYPIRGQNARVLSNLSKE